MAGNDIVEVGNLTRDPEMRVTPSGQANLKFTIAVNRTWNDRTTNQKKEQVSFFDCVCWGKLAENLGESLVKGSAVIVSGRLEQRSWEAQDGSKRSRIEIIVDRAGPELSFATAVVTKQSGGGGRPPGPESGTEIPNEPNYGEDEQPF